MTKRKREDEQEVEEFVEVFVCSVQRPIVEQTDATAFNSTHSSTCSPFLLLPIKHTLDLQQDFIFFLNVKRRGCVTSRMLLEAAGGWQRHREAAATGAEKLQKTSFLLLSAPIHSPSDDVMFWKQLKAAELAA